MLRGGFEAKANGGAHATTTSVPHATTTTRAPHGATTTTVAPSPCNQATNSGGAGVTRTTHELGATGGTFNFQYQAFSIFDQFDIFYEGNVDTATRMRPDVTLMVIFTTGGPVSGGATVPVSYGPGTATTIEDVVTGSSGTAWNYIVSARRHPDGLLELLCGSVRNSVVFGIPDRCWVKQNLILRGVRAATLLKGDGKTQRFQLASNAVTSGTASGNVSV